MQEDKRHASREVLKHLIKLAQEMMLKGMGDDEGAGDKIKEAMLEGAPEGGGDEPGGEVEVSVDLDEGDGDDEFDEYKKKEMKRGNKSMIKDRQTMSVMSAKAPSQTSFAARRGK